jgi:hypothetical protein
VVQLFLFLFNKNLINFPILMAILPYPMHDTTHRWHYLVFGDNCLQLHISNASVNVIKMVLVSTYLTFVTTFKNTLTTALFSGIQENLYRHWNLTSCLCQLANICRSWIYSQSLSSLESRSRYMV